MLQRIIGDYPYICTDKNIPCRKNGCEGTLLDFTRGSELNNDRDSKKVLDTGAETINKKNYTNMARMSKIPCNCIYSSSTRPTTARQNKWTLIISSDWIEFCRTDNL